MIFVTVGSHYQGFDRLIKKMDEIAGKTDETVIMQIGYTTYKPVNAEYFSFLEGFEEILRLNREARVVVSHAGAGSIVTALKEKNPVIVVPRLKRYNEHMNDHQLEIAKAMSENRNVTVIHDIDSLDDCLKSDFYFIEDFVDDRLKVQLKKYILSLS
ncbi:Beta-1,4-galactosyltransferase CpsIVG [Methanosarcina siciliae C2J]|uniref:Beta-1,4-galactosyltransferase CpsIVG n=2 Tax=Methanosarcina siciliae TaxID=38027 RepID=A0A0E3P5Z1_9EURY|nr:PssE/Cps14G family polysaccharide biosynthesis glycosyltransferase [Methanosarcina siciliae]AKB29148.1 Beta-1,4-galactosyltransferase CpsIVG [Methanosarcina siciliae T4/M]AKB36438.1 Beta-1,4-galactosyltransferase CpsIVG [Methanosarcina siciliae C2J]